MKHSRSIFKDDLVAEIHGVGASASRKGSIRKMSAEQGAT